jgi:hypothetical protein
MLSARMKILSLIFIGLIIVAGSVWANFYVTAPDSTSLLSPKLAGSRPVSDQETVPTEVTAKPPRSSSFVRPKPESIRFKGEYERGKICLPYGGDPRSLAMYELSSFRVIELIRGNATLRERIGKGPLTFKGIGRLKGDPGLAVGKTYTVLLVPTDETLRQIERGDEVVSLDCQEMEVVPDQD